MRDVLTAWWDHAADGPANMAADECLAAEAERRDAVLVRFYGWTAPTLSLGGFQRRADVHAAGLAGLPVVRRPSGGGAIVHGSDLTYAVAVPRRHRWGSSPATLYDAFHATLADWLRGRGIAAALHEAAVPTPDDTAPLLCFDRRAAGDLLVPAPGGPSGSVKVMGSAQRRLGGVVLQHGSLLVRTNHALPAPARHAGLAELAPAFAGVALEAVVAGWLDLLAAMLDAELVRESAPFAVGRAAEIDARAGRFRDPRWTDRR